MTDTKYRAALELGFPPHLISLALRNHSFETAGDLVDYLNDTMYVDDDEEMAVAVACNDLSILLKETLTLDTSSKIDEMSLLLKETTQLYVSIRCLLCKIERREILTFPCCHFSICKSCSLTACVCPDKNCQTPIVSTIRVRF